MAVTALLLAIGFAHARAVEKTAALCHAHAGVTAYHCH
jgi:hypothetical protein